MLRGRAETFAGWPATEWPVRGWSRVESVSTAVLPVKIPVAGRDVIVRPGHLDAACAGHRGGRGGGGREHGVGPVSLGLDLQVGILHVGWWRTVAAIEPHQKAGMGSQAQHLRAQGGGGDGEVLRGPVFPVLPMIAAAPAQHYQNALLVGQMKELIGFELALQANGVQV